MTLSSDQIAEYRERGYLAVSGVFTPVEVRELQAVTDEFVERSRLVSEHTEVFDLEPGHTAEHPRLRRLKAPHRQHPAYDRALRNERLLGLLRGLLGDSIRHLNTKLNLKSPEFGSPVEWHQDWAFYPHTNDDMLAVGVMLDDMRLENGPLMVMPGTHKGPVFDHHVDGYFAGAIDPDATDLDYTKAVSLTAPAGSMSFHHVRLVHGSAQNTSERSRQLLLYEYAAADAWPLMGVSDFANFNERVVSGEPTIVPRVVAAPIRMPLPPSPHPGSIYENQTGARNKYFKVRELV